MYFLMLSCGKPSWTPVPFLLANNESRSALSQVFLWAFIL